jgi:hypothetical protein
MTAPRAQVNPGQPLQIHAATWNALLAMLAKFQAGQIGAGRPMPAGGPPGLDVRVLNNSQYDVDRGGVLGIDGVEIDRATNADEFETRPTLTGVTPGTAHATKFLVTTEPIAYGSIGRAVLTGLAAVKVYVNNASHGYAAAKDSERGELETVATGGGAKVLWKETGTGTGKWALVLLGEGGGDKMFPVWVVKDGGSDGNSTTVASYTYTVKTADQAITLGSTVAVTRPRPYGKVTYYASGGYGLAFFDGTTLKLWDAGEIPTVGVCSS